jgi:hypothetical protein
LGTATPLVGEKPPFAADAFALDNGTASLATLIGVQAINLL